jgi:hypothetical protein
MLVNQKYKRADIKYWFSQYALFYLKQAMCGEIPEQEWHAVLLEPEAEYTNA